MQNTPKYRQQWILEELKKSPLLSFGECFSDYSAVFSKSEKTFSKDWKKAQEELQTYQNKLQAEKERVSIEIETKAVKQGLKTKIDRLLNLQKLLDDCFKDLAEGMTDDVKFDKNGVPKQFRRKMTITEHNQTRKTAKELSAEISKIEGDYAPVKQDHTTQGESLNRTITFITIDENGNEIVETSNGIL